MSSFCNVRIFVFYYKYSLLGEEAPCPAGQSSISGFTPCKGKYTTALNIKLNQVI